MIRELDLDLNARGALDISVNIPQLIKGEKGDKGDKGDKGEIGELTPEVIDGIASKIDFSEYAKKSEIPDISGKADVNHTHSQYLTQHQSLTEYAKKSELPSPYDDTEVRSLIAGKAPAAHSHLAIEGMTDKPVTSITTGTTTRLATSKAVVDYVDKQGFVTETEVETMIDNKLNPLEALADEILEVM